MAMSILNKDFSMIQIQYYVKALICILIKVVYAGFIKKQPLIKSEKLLF